MDRKPTGKNWGLTDYDDLIAGVRDPAELRVLDGRGMTPGLAAALDTGSASHRLMSLLDGPETSEGESALSRIEELLAEQVEQGRLVLEKLDAIVRLLSPRAAAAASIETTAVPGQALPLRGTPSNRRALPQTTAEPHPLG